MRDSRSNADSRHTHVTMVACTPVNPASSAGRGASCSTSAPRAFLGLAGRRRAPQAAAGSHAYRARLSAQASAAQSEAAPPAGEAKPDPFATKEVYSDNWFDRLMIWWAASRRVAPSRAALHTWGGWERPPGAPVPGSRPRAAPAPPPAPHLHPVLCEHLPTVHRYFSKVMSTQLGGACRQPAARPAVHAPPCCLGQQHPHPGWTHPLPY